MRMAWAALLLWQATAHVTPEPRHFRFERAVQAAPQAGGRACAVLDGDVYAHAEAGLADVRLFAGGAEVPYALTMSQTAPTGDVVRPLNLGLRGGHLVFDLPMPARPYSAVELKLGGQNWLATAKVTGLESLGGKETLLGAFTLFDLSGQGLGRDTSLALAESTFPYLHVDLEVQGAAGYPGFVAGPAMVDGATVPPSREAQTLYTTVAETTKILQMESNSEATFEVPAHVPVERVSFELESGDKTNFSRMVEVTARASGAAKDRAMMERVDGIISRVRMTEGGKEIRQESLSVPATLGSNTLTTARVQVAVANGDDRRLAIRAVRLEMRERDLCFDAPGRTVTMYYGDGALSAPVYDYSRVFQPTDTVSVARLGPEQANAGFVARAEPVKTLTERYPELLWVVLLGVVSVLGVVAFRSARRIR
jgi:hypothetical protein